MKDRVEKQNVIFSICTSRMCCRHAKEIKAIQRLLNMLKNMWSIGHTVTKVGSDGNETLSNLMRMMLHQKPLLCVFVGQVRYIKTVATDFIGHSFQTFTTSRITLDHVYDTLLKTLHSGKEITVKLRGKSSDPNQLWSSHLP